MRSQFLFFGMAVVFLNGCSTFYGYQPPAPVYGKGETKRTNPYAIAPVKTEAASIQKKSGNRITSQAIEKNQSVAYVNKSISRTEKVATKRIAPPAILALVSEADRSSRAGDLESAVSTIERALRIDSRNPSLTYKLAQLRLKQSKPRLAEDLAKKSALLAVNDRETKKQSWLLISEARRQQKNYLGAKEAKLKANQL